MTSAPPKSGMMSLDPPKKVQRISQACDLCHRRSIRCRPSTEDPQNKCQNCHDFAVECSYKRPSRRRRNHITAHDRITSPDNPLRLQEGSVSSSGRIDPLVPTSLHQSNERPAWHSFALTNMDKIDQLLRVYMDFFYPTLPLFHRPTLWERVRRREYLVDHRLFASIMGVCALAMTQSSKEALADHPTSSKYGSQWSSNIFHVAAADAVPRSLDKTQDLGYLQACGLLAVAAIRCGQVHLMHQYLGHFSLMSAIQHFHDELHWPEDLSLVEKEERRCLYWSMYNIDVLGAVVFDGVTKFDEASANVRYPSQISGTTLVVNASNLGPESGWLRGWNFTTDMYRVLDRATKRSRSFQQNSSSKNPPSIPLLAPDRPCDVQVMNGVWKMYIQLSDRFREFTAHFTEDTAGNLYGFQAANIQAILQLIRMTPLLIDQEHNIDQRCDIADELLSTISSICPRFLTVIGYQLAHHLSGFGRRLAKSTMSPSSGEQYRRVRPRLLSLGALLQELESGCQISACSSSYLFSHVEKIDRNV